MKHLIIFVCTIILCNAAGGQDRKSLYEKFSNAIYNQDSTAVANLISEYENLYPEDAEIYSLKANQLYLSAYHEVLMSSTELPENCNHYMELRDPEDSTVIKGYMYTQVILDTLKIQDAISILDEGISKNPNRLDLRIGKTRNHFDAGQIPEALDELSSALLYSKINDNKWLWTLDKPVKSNGVSYLRESIQGFLSELSDETSLNLAKGMIETAIRCYPNDAVFLADKAGILYYNGDLENALACYFDALKCDSEDMLIMYNIGEIYAELGHTDNALKYFHIASQSSDMEISRAARLAIEELKR